MAKTSTKQTKSTSIAELKRGDSAVMASLDAVQDGLSAYYTRVKELVTRHSQQLIVYYFRLGQLFNDMTQKKKYKRNAVNALAEAVNLNPDTVRTAMRLADKYSEDELKEFMELRTPDKTPLQWAHLRLLTNVDDKKARAKLQNEVATKGMGYRELSKKLQDTFGKRGSGGRKPKPPASLIGGIDQMVSMSQKWINFDSEVWEQHVIQALLEIDQEEITETLHGKLQELDLVLRDHRDELDENIKKVEQALNRVETSLTTSDDDTDDDELDYMNEDGDDVVDVDVDSAHGADDTDVVDDEFDSIHEEDEEEEEDEDEEEEVEPEPIARKRGKQTSIEVARAKSRQAARTRKSAKKSARK